MTSYKPQEKYDKEHTTKLTMKLNKNTDKDILDKLNTVPSKQGYIKSLIRADIAEGKDEK
jgi:hypothetical protein